MVKRKHLKSMGIEIWRLKKGKEPVAGIPSKQSSSVATPESFEEDGEAWALLEAEAKACLKCSLCQTRTNVVFGVGNRKADLLFIGEAPGANEDKQGEPFVGRAGMLLTNMIKSIGIERAEVYIANILKCRPPNNRDPEPNEVKLCTPYLERQIALIKPKLIVAVGRIAAHFLLQNDASMAELRGKTHQYGVDKTPLMVIYHPAYLLRSPREKSKAYTDMLTIKKFMA